MTYMYILYKTTIRYGERISKGNVGDSTVILHVYHIVYLKPDGHLYQFYVFNILS